MELTRSSGRDDRGRRYSVFQWEGRNVRVLDSAINSLRVILLFQDEEIDPLNKEDALRRLLYVDPVAVSQAIQDMAGLTAMVCWELMGLDLTGDHEVESDGPRAFDWESDTSVIKASLYQAYGRPWDEISREVTYRELVALMGMIPHETPLGQAIYYRTGKPPELTKYNEEQVRAWKERAEYWRIKDDKDTTDRKAKEMQAMNERACDLFEAMARQAEHGNRR